MTPVLFAKPIQVLACFFCVMLLMPCFCLGAAEPFPIEWHSRQDPHNRRMQDFLVGKKAPRLDIVDVHGSLAAVRDTKGKIVVLDFWATWCGPCIKAVPKMNALQDKYASRGVQVLGICGSSSGQDRMQAVAKQTGMQYPTARDHRRRTADDYKLTAWPHYVVIDGDGIVRAVGVRSSYLEEVVEALLKEEGSGRRRTNEKSPAMEPKAAEKKPVAMVEKDSGPTPTPAPLDEISISFSGQGDDAIPPTVTEIEQGSIRFSD